MGIGQIPAGLVADRYGRKPAVVISCLVLIVGALGAAVAPSLPMIVAFRFFFGDLARLG